MQKWTKLIVFGVLTIVFGLASSSTWLSLVITPEDPEKKEGA